MTNKNTEIIRLFKKNIFKIITSKKFDTFNKIFISEKISNNT